MPTQQNAACTPNHRVFISCAFAAMFSLASVSCELDGEETSDGEWRRSSATSKRSLALTHTRDDDGCGDINRLTNNLPDFKYYNWGASDTCNRTDHFVPMVFKSSSEIASAAATISSQPAGERWVLGPNECDNSPQCGKSVQEVAQIWRKMEQELLPLGAKLVFPVPTDAATQDDWIWQVVGKYQQLYGELPHLDRFALHLYTSDAEGFKSFIASEIGKLARGGSKPDNDGPCGKGNTRCDFDTRAVYTDSAGQLRESVTANERLFEYTNRQPVGSAAIKDVPLYADLCTHSPDQSCTFDTRAIFYDQNQKHESITAYDRLYHFTDGVAWSGNGTLLESIGRYGEICAHAGAGENCSFDTRAVQVDTAGRRVESITAYGRYFNYVHAQPLSGNGSSLTSVKRYAEGPCKGKQGLACSFDSRTILISPNGDRREAIFVDGSAYNYLNGAALGSNPINGFTRYSDVRVYRGSAFASKKYWLTEFGTKCQEGHSDAYTRDFAASVLPWLDGQEKIERYFWFANRIYGTEWWGIGWASCSLLKFPAGPGSEPELSSVGRIYVGDSTD